MKLFYTILGFIALILGCIGIALPILPTTPLLLLAAFCFAKSSEKLNNWFKSTKIYKNNLESFAKGQGMTVQTKVKILTSVTILLAIAAYFMRNTSFGLYVIGTVWVAHLIAFVFFVKTAKVGEKIDK